MAIHPKLHLSIEFWTDEPSYGVPSENIYESRLEAIMAAEKLFNTLDSPLGMRVRTIGIMRGNALLDCYDGSRWDHYTTLSEEKWG